VELLYQSGGSTRISNPVLQQLLEGAVRQARELVTRGGGAIGGSSGADGGAKQVGRPAIATAAAAAAASAARA
jgi:hypothetical protein